ncbi:hypothetical protein RhiirA4_483030 [Rhizophagus irregularis]|uniref:Uncharacterized protein n=1 Tax=Rhizophagus irregularis TaxID=588596 RepID=A0A2I1HLZ0_9GLOM|nr:hypothetical protein RhiirA4_483030 [Rhizophagus irregularis]
MEGRHFPRRRNEKSIAVNTKINVNACVLLRHCTAAYERKSVNFQWTVTREMVMLEEIKKKLCEYFTFPDGTENVIDCVIGGSGFQQEIGNAIERSLKFEGLEEAWIISQKKKSFNNNSLEKIQLIFELPSNNVSLNEVKDKAKD